MKPMEDVKRVNIKWLSLSIPNPKPSLSNPTNSCLCLAPSKKCNKLVMAF